MSAVIIRYRDAASTSDYVYLRGEPIFDEDTQEFAVGDGVTAWSGLPKFTIGGGLVDGTYGDITISVGGTVMTVANGAITLAKMADLAADRIIGRATGAGTGVPTALTAAQVKAILALAIADVTGLQTALDAKAAAARPTGQQYHVKLAAGQYVHQGVNAIAPTTGAMAANRLELVPFIPARDLTIDRLGFEVTTIHAANSARVGVWADSSGVPGSLLVGGGTSHSVGSLGFITEMVSLSMTAGTLYWLGLHSEGATAQFRACPTAGAPIFGTAAGGASAGYTTWRGTPTYASGLPNPPVSMTRTAGAIAPLIYLRVA